MSAPQHESSYQPPQPKKQQRNVTVGQVVAGILLILVVVFIVENTRTVSVRIIGPEVKAPLYVPILIAAVLGALIAALLRYRRQRRNK